MKDYKVFLMLLFMCLFFTSCLRPIIQVDGKPVSDNIVEYTILPIKTKVKYNFINFRTVKEGKEYYRSYDYLPLKKINKIKSSEKLMFFITTFNPKKYKYSIVGTLIIEGQEVQKILIYKGNLSRKDFNIVLPYIKNKLITFYYNVYDKNNNYIDESFKAQYIIEG